MQLFQTMWPHHQRVINVPLVQGGFQGCGGQGQLLKTLHKEVCHNREQARTHGNPFILLEKLSIKLKICKCQNIME